MIVLNINMTFSAGAFRAGWDDVEGVLPESVIEDLLKDGLARRVDPVSDDSAGDTESENGDQQEGTLAGVMDENGNFIALKDMKAPELKELAKEMGIEGYASMKKDELVAAIEAEQVLIDQQEGADEDDKSV